MQGTDDYSIDSTGVKKGRSVIALSGMEERAPHSAKRAAADRPFYR